MKTPKEILDTNPGVSRRNALKQIGLAGASLTAMGALAGCGGSGSANGASIGGNQNQAILNAAATAEALAVTMYYNLIATAGGIYQGPLAAIASDRSYLVAGYEEELNHFNFLVAAGAKPLTQTFYFPTNMFIDPQTTMNTLVTLEDAFIAAYLIGVRDFSTNALKVIAAQIMGIEAEHRVLGRDIASDLGLTSVTGLSGIAESFVPPTASVNNLAYERTFSSALPDINHVVAALGPFTTPGASGFAATAFSFSTAAATAPSAGQPTVVLANTAP